MDAVEHEEGLATLPVDDSLESKILRFLQQKYESRTALQISKGIGLKTAKQVNPTLYALEKRNLVHKIPNNKKIEWQAVDQDYEMMPPIEDIDDEASGSEAGSVSGHIEEGASAISTKAEMFDPQQTAESMESEHPIHEHGHKRHWSEADSSDENINPKHVSAANDDKQVEDSHMPMDHAPVQPSSIGSLHYKSTADAIHKAPASGIGRGGILQSTWESQQQHRPTTAMPNQPPERGLSSPKGIQPAKMSHLPKAPHELLPASTQVSDDNKKTSNLPVISDYFSYKDRGNEKHPYDHENASGYGQKSSPGVQHQRYNQNQSRDYDSVHQNQSRFSSPFSTDQRSMSYRQKAQHQSVQQDISQLKPLMENFPEDRFDNSSMQGNDEEMIDKIVDFLKQFHRPVATLEIAKAVNKGKKKEVNPILYEMQRRGIINKHTNQPPSWKLGSSLPTSSQKGRESPSPNPIHSSRSNVHNQSLASDSAHGQQSSFHQPQPVSQFARQLSWPRNAAGVAPQTSLSNVRNQHINTDRSLMQQSHPMPSLPGQTGPSSMHSAWQSRDAARPTSNRPAAPKEMSWQSTDIVRSIPNRPGAASAPSELSGITFAALNKNPVSALNEYAQKNQMEISFEVLNEAKGGPNKFLVAVMMNGKMYNAASAGNMKDARREAADLALREILSQQAATRVQSSPNVSQALTHFDRIAMLSHQAFITISAEVQEKFAGRKVIAAMIMKSYSDNIGKVVSIGAGNRCITGDRLNLEGKTVNDSHAEIICRRSFLHFLYSEIDNFYSQKGSLFEEGGLNGCLQVKDGVTFHLYISTAPCGDGALFSPRDSASLDPSAAVNAPRDHSPVFSSKQQGLLRTKIEDGEGTIPIDPSDGPQTWDGIVMGKRLRTMSCTDKVCRWNILGLQGALLSHLTDPIYLESITLGYLYDHGHLSRAVCCRLQKQSDVDKDLPMPYFLNHPWLGRVTAYDPPRETEKTNNLSINWHLGCKGVEVTDGRAGCCLTRTDNAPTPSRLCKAELFQHFKQVCSKVAKLHHLMDFDTYREAKEAAQSFQTAKQVMNRQFTSSKFGTWVKKPRELELFDVSNH